MDPFLFVNDKYGEWRGSLSQLSTVGSQNMSTYEIKVQLSNQSFVSVACALK